MKISHYETEGKEKENAQRYLRIPPEKQVYKLELQDENRFVFTYTSLTPEFQNDLEKILNKNFSQPNAILYAKNSFTQAKNILKDFFPSSGKVPFFKSNYATDIFLAKDFNEFCSIGCLKKRDLPSWASGRVAGEVLVYSQKPLTIKSQTDGEIPKYKIFDDAHELLHTFLHENIAENFGKQKYKLPVLLREGLNVVCANQLNRNFHEFAPADKLIFENETEIFKHDARKINENSYYQSAGQFMDYLLKRISTDDKISFEQAFENVFLTIGSPKCFDENNSFNSQKYFNETFNLDVEKEYESFVSNNSS